ncbi:MAG: hypothetical protein JNL72_07790 [Flavipsychrobacter sp.]|nr:hypothetical protein [Flavipsychrobacter sp.]
MKKLTLFITGFFCCGATWGQGYFPGIEWARCYGSSENEDAVDIKQTFDGGYIVLGKSAATDGDLINAPFGNKTWIFKLDVAGDIEWQQYLVNVTSAKNIVQTTDSGYIISGSLLTKLTPNGQIDWQYNHPQLICNTGV